MISLINSGLPIQLCEETGLLTMDESIGFDPVGIRRFGEASSYYETRAPLSNDMPLYYMYRNVHKLKDLDKIKQSLFRYDITVVLPGLIDLEYIKTIGHLHPFSLEAKGKTYTEVYSVIYGTAHYILQKYNEDLTQVSDVVDLIVHEGEHVLIPSHYGHVTVNVGSKPLVMANILYRNFNSHYEPYQKNKGAAIYLKQAKDKPYDVVKNHLYSHASPYRTANASDFIPPDLLSTIPLYSQFVENLSGFHYLYQ